MPRVAEEIGDNGPMNIAPLTERDAARAWALAYNTHDPSVAGPDPRRRRPGDVAVGGQRPRRSGRLHRVPKPQVHNLRKYGFVGSSRSRDTPLATPRGSSGRPCALIEQDGSALATVFFEVVAGRIVQISLGPHPPPESCLRTGEFPGFEKDDDLVN